MSSALIRSVASIFAPPRVLLEDLVREIRVEAAGMPLTILVHGWESAASGSFLGGIEPFLYTDDAVWLPRTGMAAPSALADAARYPLLDLQDERARHAYHNVTGDLVFFPASDAIESTLIVQWKGRAGAVIVDGRGPVAAHLHRAGAAAGMAIYRWLGGGKLAEAARSARA